MTAGEVSKDDATAHMPFVSFLNFIIIKVSYFLNNHLNQPPRLPLYRRVRTILFQVQAARESLEGWGVSGEALQDYEAAREFLNGCVTAGEALKDDEIALESL